jgi:hypothetical protein
MTINNSLPATGCQSTKNRSLYLLLPAILLFGACGNSGDKIPDVSNIKVELKTYRFDKDLYALDTNHLGAGLAKLKNRYPDFLDYYLDTIRAYGIHGNFSDTAKGGIDSLRIDLTYRDFVQLEDTIIKYYPDSKETDKELTEGFRYIKYYLPGYTLPRILYLNMGLSKWPSFPVDSSTLCIGLDMFLGDQFPHYRAIGVADYMLPHFRKSYLPVSLFKTVYETMQPFNPEDKTLLDLMIQRGKEQYFLHQILPRTADTTLYGFTGTQLKWCGENEALIYNFFIHQNLLYSKEGHAISPYIHDGPFAKDLESPSDPIKYTPGNIGSWLGYRIVSAWMAEHPKTTLAVLITMHPDPPKFLEEAKYRPKQK